MSQNSYCNNCPKAAPQQEPVAIVVECGNLYAKIKLSGEAFGTTKVGDELYRAPTAPAPLSDDVVKDAARWRLVETASSEVTLRLHNLRPDRRAQYIDAAIAAQGGK